MDYTHPDLGGCTREQFLSGERKKVAGGYDYFDNDPDPMDFYGHGIHVASIAAGFKGVAPGATIYAYKFTDKEGRAYIDTIIRAIEDISSKKEIDVLGMSFGVRLPSDSPLSNVVNRIARRGIIPVVSAGNVFK